MLKNNDIPLPLPVPTETVPAVILADGDYPAGEIPAGILARAQRVICCDGATLAFVERGGDPFAIVGDCDSLPGYIQERFGGIISFDGDQETNDLTKTVKFCIENGLGDITILGATGKREDHTIGNIGLLPDYGLMAGVDKVRMITDRGVFEPIYGHTRFRCYKGQQVSVFCPDPVTRITTEDLLFPLNEAHLTAWWQGTLNECLGEDFGIVTTGPAVVFRLF